MPVAAAAEQVVQSLVGNGYDDVDFAALLEYEAKAAGLDLRPEDAPVIRRPVGRRRRGATATARAAPEAAASRADAERAQRRPSGTRAGRQRLGPQPRVGEAAEQQQDPDRDERADAVAGVERREVEEEHLRRREAEERERGDAQLAHVAPQPERAARRRR